MSKRKILPILAVIFAVCLTGIGAYLIFLAVWGHTKLGFEAPVRDLAFMFGLLGVLALIGAALLFLRAFRGPKRNGKRISKG
jgi:nitrate reductase gamma subunit